MSHRTSWICPQALLLQIESLKQQLQLIEDRVYQTVVSQEDKIFELESMVNPYSASGQAICNSYSDEEDCDE